MYIGYRKPSNNEQEQERHQEIILASIEKAGLDDWQLIVMGGGALALAGIRPPQDLDIMVSSTHYQELECALATPTNIKLLRKPGTKHPFLTSDEDSLPNGSLGLDITYPHILAGDHIFQEDDLFHEALQSLNRIGDNVYYLSPETVAAHKKGSGRDKDKQDIHLIHRHLKHAHTAK